MSVQAVQQKPFTVENRHAALGLQDADVVRMYRLMVLARRASECTLALAFQGRIMIAVPADGHEAAQVGAVSALEPADHLYPYYRGIGAALTRGQSIRQVMLDHFGRAEARNSGGRQMPTHWSDPSLHLITNSSSVGTHIPHAAGTALASRLRGEAAVTYASFGEGAVSKGDFHEGVSFAAIHKLPALFVCENNRYAISVPFRVESPVRRVADRAAGYGIPGVSVDGMDVLAVYGAVREARARAIRGEGPTLLEARVYRYSLHTSHVGVENYRDQQEIERERRHDPIPSFRRYLLALGLLTDTEADALAAEVEAEIDAAVREAERAPAPPAEQATRNVFASSG
jgi:2-oxoisovalerate dehydrogenase E1 component alpha subunit